MSIHPIVRSSLRHPVTLEPLKDEAIDLDAGFLNAAVGDLTAKNLAELGFATDDYTEPDGQSYVDRLTHMQHPAIGSDDIVVDIGCGPRSFLDGLPGHHVFVDDLIGAYVTQLGARFDGLAVNARSELLPFADESISVIYSVNMLDHVDDLPETMFELHRVLRPNGVVALQTYFNSHPLLHSEPGVVDRYAFDTLIEPYFVVENLRTHQVESPEISDYYTMGIMTCQLRKRDLPTPQRDRNVYAQPGFLGPQSRITECLDDIAGEDWSSARTHIDSLGSTEHYQFHVMLLEAKLAIAEGRLGEVNGWIRKAREHRRGKRNPYARIAIKEIELERLNRAIEVQAGRTADARTGIERRDARIAELGSAIAGRDARIAELDEAVVRRDLRIARLDRAIATRGKQLTDLGVEVDATAAKDFEAQMADAGQRIADLQRRLAELTR
jgi:SAM-dependent methyltransferase